MTDNHKISWSWFPRPIQAPAGFNRSPVFVTGIPRCGSSWVGEVLSHCTRSRYVYEPFNFRWAPALRGQLRHFRYFNRLPDVPVLLKDIAEGAFKGRQSWNQIGRAAYRGYLSGACRQASRVVVKDPTASLMAAWINESFNARILIIIRHPCGFASSLDALNWPLDVIGLLRQETLMHDHLEPYRDTLRQARGDKWLTRGAIWGAIHTVFSRQMNQHPDWQVFRYEDLCIDPERLFTRIIDTLGLEKSKYAEDKIRSLSNTRSSDSGSTRRKSTEMPRIWQKRMSPGQIDAVNGIVSEFKLDFYQT